MVNDCLKILYQFCFFKSFETCFLVVTKNFLSGNYFCSTSLLKKFNEFQKFFWIHFWIQIFHLLPAILFQYLNRSGTKQALKSQNLQSNFICQYQFNFRDSKVILLGFFFNYFVKIRNIHLNLYMSRLSILKLNFTCFHIDFITHKSMNFYYCHLYHKNLNFQLFSTSFWNFFKYVTFSNLLLKNSFHFQTKFMIYILRYHNYFIVFDYL